MIHDFATPCARGYYRRIIGECKTRSVLTRRPCTRFTTRAVSSVLAKIININPITGF